MQRPFPQTRAIALWYFAYFAFVGAFVPYFPLYLKESGLDVLHIGTVLAAGQLMRVLVPTFWGWASDVSGRRVPLIRGSAALSLLLFLGYFSAQGFIPLLLVTTLLYAAWSGAYPLVEALTFAQIAQTPGRYGRIRLWGSFGFVVAVLCGGWALDGRPLGGLLWLTLATLAGVLLAACSMRDMAPPTGLAPDSAPPPSAALVSPDRASERALRRAVVTVLLSSACMAVAHGPLYAFLSLYLEQAGYSRTLVSWLWALGVFAEITVFLWQPYWARRASVRGVLLACFAAAVLRFVLLAQHVDVLGVVLLAQLLHGATFGAHHVASAAALNRWFPVHMQGRIQAMYSSVSFGAGGMLGAWAGGAIWQTAGAAASFRFAAGCALLGLLVVACGLHRLPADAVPLGANGAH